MQVKAIDRLFVRDRPEGEYIEPGEIVDVPDWRAERWIVLGAAAAVTASEAARITKAATKRVDAEAKAAQAAEAATAQTVVDVAIQNDSEE